jgi:hypothetical protein
MNYSGYCFSFFKQVKLFMRFRNDKFAGKVVANCGEFQFQKLIYVTTNLLRLFALLGSQIHTNLKSLIFLPQISQISQI